MPPNAISKFFKIANTDILCYYTCIVFMMFFGGVPKMLKMTEWNKEEIEKFNQYLESLKRPDKIEFSERTINTKMEVLGIDTPTLRRISKSINQGNYIQYLDYKNNRFYENTIINACLINQIKDIARKRFYIENSLIVDNWATCDILTFDIKGMEDSYIDLAKEYLKSKDTFIRRIGVRILFNYTKSLDTDTIFSIISTLYDEQEYYVNMAVAWLLCELMIHNREKTLQYLEKHNLNKFVINKMISKCRDSYRITREDKDYLLKYRVK